MITLETKLIEATSVILEQGVDYEAGDLVSDKLADGTLFELPQGQLNEIAKAYGFDKCEWSSHAEKNIASNCMPGLWARFIKILPENQDPPMSANK